MVVTIGLGTWQVKRLQWKEGLIAKIEQAKLAEPITVLSQNPAELEAKNFYPAQVRGTWVRNVEFHITPRFFHGKLGYFVITPLTLDDGRTLLVNRGWVPARQKKPESRPETAVRGRATLRGMIRTGNERNWLTPASNVQENIWFGRDTAAMAESAKLKNPIPAMLDIVGVQDENHLPVPSDGTIKLRNDHLSYIVTWYGIAFSILVIFILYHRKK